MIDFFVYHKYNIKTEGYAMINFPQETNGTVEDTGRLMHDMVLAYHNDMGPYIGYTLEEIFDLIKSIPFQEDPPSETLQRPLYTMQQRGYGGDCDDKCIALACWAVLNGYGYRFIAVRRSDYDSFHHVYCDIYSPYTRSWIHADPTYKFNTLGQPRERYEEYKRI